MISLFIPIYNGEKILETNIIKIYNFLKKNKYKFEIIIVDDNSKDNTLKIVKKLSKKHKEIKYLHYENGPSRRENLAKSFLNAKEDIIAFMDADLSVDLEYFNELINKTKENDIVIGSRYSGIKAERSMKRLLISMIYNNFMKLLFNSKIRDHQCGFKVFKKEVIINLLDKLGYDKTFDRGWFWDVELLVRAQNNNYKITEIAVKWKGDKESTFNIKRELRILKYILRNRKKIKTGEKTNE